MTISIIKLTAQTGLNEDEIRMILMEVREDWETTETVTQSEADLIIQSTKAALPGSDDTGITPVNNLPVQQQQAIVNAASQVLGEDLILALDEKVQIFDAAERLTNEIILNNIEHNRRTLTNTIKQDNQQLRVSILNGLQQLSGQAKELPEIIEHTGLQHFNTELEKIQKKIRG
ncbi:MAG: hypothetical protein AAF316_00295 [Cyanobacteria bacterium P01_A01_bin.80]